MKKIVAIILSISMMVSFSLSTFGAMPKKQISLGGNEDKYSFNTMDSSKFGPTSYGIITEDYSIMYTSDEQGNVVIDRENLLEFQKLLNDKTSIKKILKYKEINKSKTSPSKEQLNLLAEQVIRDFKPIVDSKVKARSEISLMGSITNTPLQNFSGQIGSELVSVVNTPHTTDFVNITRNMIYAWTWDYAPAQALTDLVGVGWGENWIPCEETVTFAYIQVDLAGNYHYTTFSEENAFDEMPIASGIGKHYDIKNMAGNYAVASNRGIYNFQIIKTIRKGENPLTHSKGTYYHKTFGFNASLSVSVNNGIPNMGLNLAFTSIYQQSPISSDRFMPYDS